MAHGHTPLLGATTIAAAVANQLSNTLIMKDGVRTITAEAQFLYGAGGTTCKAWLQTSLDGGTTWIDIASFAFTTAALKKVSKLTSSIALAAAVTPTDATLADNTIVDGLLGSRFRVKYTTTGTYSGATSLQVDVVTS